MYVSKHPQKDFRQNTLSLHKHVFLFVACAVFVSLMPNILECLNKPQILESSSSLGSWHLKTFSLVYVLYVRVYWCVLMPLSMFNTRLTTVLPWPGWAGGRTEDLWIHQFSVFHYGPPKPGGTRWRAYRWLSPGLSTGKRKRNKEWTIKEEERQ